jgi:hypothetical protein
LATFTIDSDNHIVAHAGIPASADNQQRFTSEKELAELAADWPGARLIEVWNSFAGVAPFDGLKPVKKFTSRQIAVRRIWQAVARLSSAGTPAEEKPEKVSANAENRHTARPGADGGRTSKKAAVIALMKRAKGATLSQMMEATGWQKHTVRGFVSILGRKGGEKIESTNPAGERTYRIPR